MASTAFGRHETVANVDIVEWPLSPLPIRHQNYLMSTHSFSVEKTIEPARSLSDHYVNLLAWLMYTMYYLSGFPVMRTNCVRKCTATTDGMELHVYSLSYKLSGRML